MDYCAVLFCMINSDEVMLITTSDEALRVYDEWKSVVDDKSFEESSTLIEVEGWSDTFKKDHKKIGVVAELVQLVVIRNI